MWSPNHMARSVSVTSTFVADRAGLIDASATTATSTAAASDHRTGSKGWTPTRRVRKVCANAYAPASPTSRPIAVIVAVPESTSRQTAPRVAPSATRMTNFLVAASAASVGSAPRARYSSRRCSMCDGSPRRRHGRRPTATPDGHAVDPWCQSARSVSLTSTRVAATAGRIDAVAATTTSRPTAIDHSAGSSGVTPTSRELKTCAKA
jgi:hypothetical protein